ncbi:MAG: hypothetical protein GX817_05065 [Elusimicrobia bacterium]|nr:hypothetical protein [Elusimicrobiota bacterium]
MKLLKPSNAAEAVKLKKANPKARYVSGGTEIFSHQAVPPYKGDVIDISRILNNSISPFQIGAAATLEEIRTSFDTLDFMKQATSNIGNINIRNMGTIGGNIASGKSSSDIIPALIASKASLTVEKEKGREDISVEDWISSPEGIILFVNIPDSGLTVLVRKFSRTTNDIAIMNLAIGYKLDNDTLEEIIIVAGCLGPQVVRLKKTEDYLLGKDLSEIEIEDILNEALGEISPVTDHRASKEYRMSLVKAGLEEFLREVK